jgi:hypothetical protein
MHCMNCVWIRTSLHVGRPDEGGLWQRGVHALSRVQHQLWNLVPGYALADILQDNNTHTIVETSLLKMPVTDRAQISGTGDGHSDCDTGYALPDLLQGKYTH